MRLLPVESSAIEAVGYEAGVLRVKFRSGKSYDYRVSGPEVLASLLAAESIGRFVTSELGTAYFSPSNEAEKQEVRTLNTHAEDPCCALRLAKALQSGSLDNTDTWICPKCGCEWLARVVDNSVRHWEIREWAEVMS